MVIFNKTKRKLRKKVGQVYGKGFVRGVFDKLNDGEMVGSSGDTLLYLSMIENAREGFKEDSICKTRVYVRPKRRERRWLRLINLNL